MKKYGLILADNGSAMFVSGAPDSRWNNTDLHALGQLTAASFEVVQTGTIYTSANVPAGTAPAIGSFTASAASIATGQSITLNWSTTNSEYNIVTPMAGAVRGASIVVTPSATTTFTLEATNQYGRTVQSVTVTVH